MLEVLQERPFPWGRWMCAYSSCACTDQSYAAFQCVASQLCSQMRKDPKSAVCLPCRLLCWMDPSFNRHQTLNTGKGKVWSLEMELGEGTQLKLSAENQDGKPCQKLWTEDRSQTAGQRTRNNRRLHYDFILRGTTKWPNLSYLCWSLFRFPKPFCHLKSSPVYLALTFQP